VKRQRFRCDQLRAAWMPSEVSRSGAEGRAKEADRLSTAEMVSVRGSMSHAREWAREKGGD
jgi:hypothetical protein